MTQASDNEAFVLATQRWLAREGHYAGELDAWAGERTFEALDAASGGRLLASPGGQPPGLRLLRTERLADDQIVKVDLPKDLIVLHHTVGGSALSTINWWRKDPARIGTAYVVERDGTVYEVFDPAWWAFHLGLSGTGGAVDRRSIGIEIASEGALVEDAGRLYAFGVVSARTEFTGEVWRPPGGAWRGWPAFAAYTPAAVEAVGLLVRHLLHRFRIPRQTPADHDAHDVALHRFRGVVGHHHLRADKSDVHPGFPWDRLVADCDLGLA